MIKIGLVGLPNAGKTTIFNALSGQSAAVADYPFTTIETNKATVNMADVQLEVLAERVNAPDIKYSQVELWDIAGLIEGASTGSGLGNEFLSQIKDCDILLHVVKISDSTKEDIQTFLREVALFDHDLLQKPFEKNRHLSRVYPNEKVYVENNGIISRYRSITSQGRLPDGLGADKNDQLLLTRLGVVGLKPIIPVFNSSSDIAILVTGQGDKVQINASTLSEISSLSRNEQEQLGIDSTHITTQLSRLFDLILSKIDFKHFYTIGHLGVGQWSTNKSSNAYMCSQLLHDEFEPSMVRVASYHDVLKYGNWDELQKAGKVRMFKAHKYIPMNRDVLKFIQ